MTACIAGLLSACASPSARMGTMTEKLADAGYYRQILPTAPFPLFTARPLARAVPESAASPLPRDSRALTIVIEGDGYAWVNRNTISDNPTPRHPAGFDIAAALQPGAIYLARPCQYAWTARCRPYYWTAGRFDDSVLQALDDALGRLKAAGNAQNLHLIGYSGGAYLALKLAAARQDVAMVTTIAGVLNPQGWTAHHDVSPLRLSQSTDDLLGKTRAVRFHHFCGTEDDVAPCSLTRHVMAQAERMGLHNHRMTRVNGDHDTAWRAALPLITP